MRTLTLARMGRALLLAAAMIMLPQLASAQLPVESKVFKIQATSGSNAVTLTATTVTTPYSLNLPAVAGGAGAFLYASDANGALAWSDVTGIGDGWYPRWDLDTDPGTPGNQSAIVWTDPAGADNPNWSLTGNALTATGVLGTSTAFGINVVTNGTTNVRMSISDAGVIGINNGANGGATTTIGRASGHTTAIDGTTNITGATTIVGTTSINTSGGAAVSIGSTGSVLTTIGSLDHTGTSTFDGAVTLEASSPLITGATPGPGTAGYVLTSAGGSASPEWQSINDAVGIKSTGKLTITGAATGTVALASIEADDKVILTVEGATGVIAQIGSITASTNFTVNLSAATTCTVHYIVLN